MEYGDKIKFFKTLQAQGSATPLDEQVPATDTAIWYLEVFHFLNRSRSIGMSNGPIPPRPMYDYIDRNEIIGTEEEFLMIMCAMDDAYLRHVSEEREKERKRNASKRNASKPKR